VLHSVSDAELRRELEGVHEAITEAVASTAAPSRPGVDYLLELQAEAEVLGAEVERRAAERQSLMESTPHQTCALHKDLAEHVLLSRQIVETIPELNNSLNAHMLGEGHPLLKQQLEYMKADHDRHTAVLERLVETVTVACQGIKQLQDDRDKLALLVKGHDEKIVQIAVSQASETGMNSTNWKTLSAVGLLVLGNIAGLVVALLKTKLGG